MRRQILDPELATRLMPDYGLGCKRPASSNSYLSSFNRDNVELITAGFERVCPEGVVDGAGTLHPIDTLVLATGFQTTEKGSLVLFSGSNAVEATVPGTIRSAGDLVCFLLKIKKMHSVLEI